MIRKTAACSSLLAMLLLGTIFGQQNPREQDKARTPQPQPSTDPGPQGHDPHSSLFFDHKFMDTDKDGRVSKNEYQQAFAKLDGNSDGYISSDEWRGVGPHSTKSSPGSSDTRDSSKDRKK
jgi:hypothetical protein